MLNAILIFVTKEVFSEYKILFIIKNNTQDVRKRFCCLIYFRIRKLSRLTKDIHVCTWLCACIYDIKIYDIKTHSNISSDIISWLTKSELNKKNSVQNPTVYSLLLSEIFFYFIETKIVLFVWDIIKTVGYFFIV